MSSLTNISYGDCKWRKNKINNSSNCLSLIARFGKELKNRRMYLEVEDGEVQFKWVAHLSSFYPTTSPENHFVAPGDQDFHILSILLVGISS